MNALIYTNKHGLHNWLYDQWNPTDLSDGLVWIGLPVLCLTASYSKQVLACIPLQGINNAECE